MTELIIIITLISLVVFIYRMLESHNLAKEWVTFNVGGNIALVTYNVNTKYSNTHHFGVTMTSFQSLINIVYTKDERTFYQLYFGGLEKVPSNIIVRYFIYERLLKNLAGNDTKGSAIIAIEVVNKTLHMDEHIGLYVNSFNLEKLVTISYP